MGTAGKGCPSLRRVGLMSVSIARYLRNWTREEHFFFFFERGQGRCERSTRQWSEENRGERLALLRY